MEPKTIQALETFHRILHLPPPALPTPIKDPLKPSTAAAAERPHAGGDTGPSRRRCPARLRGRKPKGKAKTKEHA